VSRRRWSHEPVSHLPGHLIRDRQRETREHERRFHLSGTPVRVLAGGPPTPGRPDPELASAIAEAVLRSCRAELAPAEPDSELGRLNADPAPVRRTSTLLIGAVRAALVAAGLSGGLVDPTLLDPIEELGWAASRLRAEPGALAEAVRAAPPRSPAAPAAGRGWAAISVVGREVRRPPGLRLDLGGTAKGYAADGAARALRGQHTFAVDAGGDIVVGGTGEVSRWVTIANPLDPGRAFAFELAAGAVATSGLGTRLWRTENGFAHHLLDPATGRPAWTGVIQATALASTGVEAETLAKTALLSGPECGLRVLEPMGGALILDSGELLLAGPLRDHAREAA
jgi:thiamine biosynthesis lipoprotein